MVILDSYDKSITDVDEELIGVKHYIASRLIKYANTSIKLSVISTQGYL